MKEILIVDYGMCNLDSVARAVERCGGRPLVSPEPAEVRKAAGIILPGVGSFNDAMAELDKRQLIAPLRQQVLERNIPFLGICLGMQLMASQGHEGGDTEGLGLIPGEVVRLEPDSPATRIPHVGWNEVDITQASPIFQGLSSGTNFYFVHSYHYRCEAQYILGRTPYCGGFASAIGSSNRFGVQFHPEKSLKAGFALLTNFLELC